MGEGTDRPVGERRRRREAERAAAASATPQPLTRRELRRREAEEAARLEAIATGELPLDEVAERMRATPAGTTAAAGSAPEAGSAPSVASAPSAAPAPSAGRAAVTADSAPSAASPGGATTTAGSAPSAASAGGAAVTAGSAPSASSAPSGTAPRLPSRRSLRNRAQDAAAAPPERPQERTATGRRPVVRTPSTAQGVRALDSTGRLTGIQPVVRPDAPHQPDASQPPSAPVTEWGEHDTFSLETDEPGGGLPRERLAAPTVDTPGHEDEDEYPLRPQWVAINHIEGGSPDEARSDLPTRRTRRERPDEDEPTEPQRDNPAATLVKVAVLVLVALVLGALIWLLATEAFADDETPAPAGLTSTTTPYPEEFRAR